MDVDKIKIYEENHSYWQYKGKPILLRGASDEDNLFQWTDETLIEHLDLLLSVGGNYVRNTMSDRDPGNVYAFKQINDNLYDLNQWNDEYWQRLEFFLKETKSRDIIIQLTLWDQHDLNAWATHPWNPKCNVNIDERTLQNSDAFFQTVTTGNTEVLNYQNQYIDKLLSMTLEYDHILYNINNESWAGIDWENYWAKKIHAAVDERNESVEITTMHMYPASSVRACLHYRNLYSFIDISQINQDSKGQKGQRHWDELMRYRNVVQTAGLMPLNNEKIYGSQANISPKIVTYNTSAGLKKEAIQRFWRDVFGGCASVRFHRPTDAFWGIGLSEEAMASIKSLTLLLEQLDVFQCTPNNGLLNDRNENEAYCMANIGDQYAVYFPEDGSVELDHWIYGESMNLMWLNIDEQKWLEAESVKVEWETVEHEYKFKGRVRLTTPGSGSWVALLSM
ncbi:hypothetical protein QA612_20810 [Evansella sp. AB-P1]|uniref:hypothetical protein n=1 Tax=Evansella sp. AB-P1 TaxID=3037653 RepID=UPI0024201A60|nr:hypothetical protein [Evansella sp. AB-P1]MDG5789901.1 hypothetical protein [Evansella sp. AB-P1]